MMEELRCVVERVTYSSEETGFCVLQARADGLRDTATLVGAMAGVRPGASLRVLGQWKLNPQYGPQFAVERWEEQMPTDPEGIFRYLSGGSVRGVGPHSARLIVEAFGEDTLRVLDEDPERLLEVPGIGEKRLRMIRTAWEAQKEIRDIMIFLQAHEVGASHAARIYRHYGADSIARVRENPYRLADDIRGIGFVTADRIARSLGFDLNGYARCRSGLVYTLNRLADDGHCYALRGQLEDAAVRLLGIEASVVTMTVDHMLDAGELFRETLPSGEGMAVYLPAFFFSEWGLARRLRALMDAPAPLRAELPPGAGAGGVTFNALQLEAIRTAASSKCMVLTGGPGTGKTTTLMGILDLYRRQGLKPLLAAPTGRAAKRMAETTGLEAKTIHRLLEYSPSEGYRHGDKNPLKGDVLIVDEVSMIDLVLMYSLLKAVPDHMRLVLVGDADQLPSIGAGSVLRDLIASGVIPVIHLEEIFRQAGGSQIIRNAHRVNRGEMPLAGNGKDTDYFFIEEQDPAKLAELIAELCAVRLPRFYGADPIRDIQVLTPMVKGELGVQNLNALLQRRLNPVPGPALGFGGLEYRPNDKVIQVRNDYDKEVFNGDIGFVSRVDVQDRSLEAVFDGKPAYYDVSDLDELALAYACTVHKAQGSEYPIVVMPVSERHHIMLQRNLLYTGMTRARRVLVLAGTASALRQAVRNNRTARRNTLLRERLKSPDGLLGPAPFRETAPEDPGLFGPFPDGPPLPS